MNSGRALRLVWVSMFCAVALCGCATTGKHRRYTDTAGLVIGKTTPAECREVFGEPRETRDETSGDGSFEVFRYVKIADIDAQGNARTLVLEFKEGVLNGFVAASSFSEDRSTFAVTNVAQIKWGKTSKEEVRRLLGEPGGVVRCPTKLFRDSDSDKAGLEVWIYHDLRPVALRVRPRVNRLYQGSKCAIVFDVNNVVTDIAQTTVH